MNGSRNIFIQSLVPSGVRVTAMDAGAVKSETRRVPDLYLVNVRRGAARNARRFERVLRWLAMAIWLSPLMLVPKCTLNFIDPALSDAIAVLFVALVVSFFVVLIGFVVFRLVVGSRDEQEQEVLPPFLESERIEKVRGIGIPAAEEGRVRPESLQALVDRVVVTRGKLRGLNDEDVLLQDFWGKRRDLWQRWTELGPCIVETDGVPLLLEFDEPPALVADCRETTAAQAQAVLPAEQKTYVTSALKRGTAADEGYLVTLRAGDEVEVAGRVTRVIDDVSELDPRKRSEASAYRKGVGRGSAGLCATSRPGDVVLLKRL